MINGCQINHYATGIRTIYSVNGTVEGKTVKEVGMVYGLSDFVEDEDIYIRDDSRYIAHFAATPKGIISKNYSATEDGKSYAMTMMFAVGSAAELSERYAFRAYALLEDGTYAYSKVIRYSAYDIAVNLYSGRKASNPVAHENLYNKIIKVVTPDYDEIEYDLNDMLYTPGK